jgi:hypothetical protein
MDYIKAAESTLRIAQSGELNERHLRDPEIQKVMLVTQVLTQLAIAVELRRIATVMDASFLTGPSPSRL